jgi:hypothetical protein
MSTPTAPANEYPNRDLIRHGINFRFDIKLRKLSLNVRPLSTMEEDSISQSVLDDLEKLPEHKRTSLKQSALLSIKKLEMAQTSDINMKDSKMTAVELQTLTPGELQFLFKEYIAGCDKVNPKIESFSQEELAKWVDHLKKNSSEAETTLIESSFYTLVGLCLHLLTQPESPEAS